MWCLRAVLSASGKLSQEESRVSEISLDYVSEEVKQTKTGRMLVTYRETEEQEPTVILLS